MKHLLLVAHAPSENTQRLLQALLEGARETDSIQITHKAPLDTVPDDAQHADAVILFTPENLGYMSGAMKDFFDRCYYPLLESKQGLPCAIVIRAGHDGTGTRRALDSILTGLKWKQVQEPLVLRGEWQESFIEQCHTLGASMAAGVEMGIY